MPDLPLQGIRVLDCTQLLAGPFCTLLLGDMGADVVKVEKPNGDDARRFPPFIAPSRSPVPLSLSSPPFPQREGGQGVRSESAPFMGINRNKRGIILDLQSAPGREAFRRLARSSDVLVENYRPGTLDRLGLSFEALRADNAALIYCSVSGFGRTGPYRHRGGFDLVAQAMGGIMSVTGNPGSPPVKVGVPIADLNAGMYACYGILNAYIQRLRTGRGQLVDTSLLEAGIAYTFWESAIYFATGQVPAPLGSAHRLSAPYQAFRASDGYVTIGANNQALWEKLCAVLELPDLPSDPRFIDNGARVQHYRELAAVLEERFQQRTVAHWLAALEQAGVPAGPLYDMAQVYADPHVQAREMVVELDHPVAGPIRNIGIPVKLSETPGRIRSPAPTLGQHTEEVLRERGFSPAEIQSLRAAGALG